MSGFLDGKTIVIMGVANKRSIAWGCTQAILDQGAKVILSYQNDRIKKSLERFVPDDLDLIECDVSDDANVSKAFEEIGQKYGKIDGVIHAIAFADKDTLTSGLANTTKEGYCLLYTSPSPRDS